MRKLSLKELNRVDVSTYKEQSKTPISIILDNVRSGLNVGSAFRTSDAFALQHIFLCGITAQPPHREILKTAIGATESVDWSYAPSTIELVKQLQGQGYEIWAVEQAEGSQSLATFEVDTNKKYALVFGNEVHGVGEEVMQVVDGAIEVPQFGTKHSLNISVCLGVVSWELAKHWF